MAKTIVGVDIGTYSVKCVVLQEEKDTYRPRVKEEYFLPGNGGGLPDFDFLKTVLTDLVSKYHIQQPLFSFSVPHIMPYAVMRIFNMPNVSLKEISQGIHFEIQEKAMIEDLDAYFYKWEILETLETEQGSEVRLMAVAMQKDYVNLLKGVKKLGYSINLIEPQAVSLGRVIGGNIAVIDFGHSSSRLVIYKEGKPCYFQTIEIGGNFISNDIVKAFPGLNAEEVKRLKHEKCAVLLGHQEIESDPMVLELSDAIAGSVRRLASEIKRSLRSVEIAENFKIENVYHIGNAARLKYLLEYLSREIEMELLPISLTSRGMDPLGDYSFTLASGAWLSVDYAYFKNMNFLKVAGTKDYSKYGINHILRALLALLLLTQLGMAGIYWQATNRLYKVQEWTDELKGKKAEVQEEINSIRQKLQPYELIDSVLSMTPKQRNFVSDVLYEIPLSVPEGISLSHVSINPLNKIVNLYGLSNDYSNIGFFAIHLEPLCNNKVTINSIVEGQGAYEFHISLDLSNVVGGS